MKNIIIKIMFIIICIMLAVPSTIYIIQNKTVLGFDTYYNFFIRENYNKIISTSIYLILFVTAMGIYLKILKEKDVFKNIKEIIKYVAIVGIIFLVMLPWTTSDIFYYMGVGELDAKYGQNPYYTTIAEYYEKNQESINDEILEQGANNVWASTTVVYGPIAQTIFKLCSLISFKNIDLCLFIFKTLNLIIHLSNCYLMYRITEKKIFPILYGLNPFILIEFIANVHNDILIIFFVLLALYFIIKKKNILVSILFLALGTGIKYSTVLLLPIIVLYYLRDEQKIWKKILKCVEYGILFLIILVLEYIPYIDDINVFLAMLPQLERYSKSVYSALLMISPRVMIDIKNFFKIIFILYYLYNCIEFLVSKKNNISDMLRKYNIIVVLSLLLLTNCHQWYLAWLFPTLLWQKERTIMNIIGITAATEIANSIYMFRTEWYIYDIFFIEIIILMFLIWQVIIKIKNNYISEIKFN